MEDDSITLEPIAESAPPRHAPQQLRLHHLFVLTRGDVVPVGRKRAAMERPVPGLRDPARGGPVRVNRCRSVDRHCDGWSGDLYHPAAALTAAK